jgi:LPXTG-site transpeptidase (sortase) family protein
VAGQTITTLTITLQNPKSTPYTGATLTDNLPTPLIVAGTPTSNCGVPPGTLSTTTTSVHLAGGTIPPGTPANPGSCTISVPVTAPAGSTSGRVTNRIPPTGLTTDQGVGPLSAANASVTISGTGLGAAKSFSPTSITAGANSRLRITITAPNDTDLTNLRVQDDLPSGVTIANSPPAPAPSTTCGASATVTATSGSSLVLLENGSLASGQDCQIDVYVTGSVPGTYTNTIPPTNITNDQNRQPTDNISSGLNVTAGSGLSISLVKGFEPPQVFGGATSTLSIELINPDGVTLTGISFSDDMPMENNVPGTGMILANPPNFKVGTCGGTLTGVPGTNSFSFSGGSLPPFGSCTLTLMATMTVNGNRTNIIPAGAVKTDNLVTNAEPTRASLTNLPGASVNKSFAPNPIPAGSYSLLTITIQNTGTIELIGMGLSDSLPAGLAIAGGSAPAPVNNCGGTFTAVAGTQLIQLTNGTLAGNSACTMVVPITGSAPGDYQNTIPAGALRTDPSVGATNSTPATDTLTITGASGGGGGGGGGGRGKGNNSSKAGKFLIPVTGFAPGMVTKLDPASHPVYDATGLDIQIPVIKVDASIVGVQSRDGDWDIAWLQDQVGWLNGTAYPTWRGNSVLTAHVVNADGKPGIFYRLKSLGVGEYIFVYNAGYRYTYKVISNTDVQPDDASVMKHEEKSYLTLITCDSYDEKTGTYLRRVAVQATLVDVRPIR